MFTFSHAYSASNFDQGKVRPRIRLESVALPLEVDRHPSEVSHVQVSFIHSIAYENLCDLVSHDVKRQSCQGFRHDWQQQRKFAVSRTHSCGFVRCRPHTASHLQQGIGT